MKNILCSWLHSLFPSTGRKAPQGYSVHGFIPKTELAFNKYSLSKRLNEWCHLNGLKDFPGGPVVKTLHFHCREHGFDP